MIEMITSLILVYYIKIQFKGKKYFTQNSNDIESKINNLKIYFTILLIVLTLFLTNSILKASQGFLLAIISIIDYEVKIIPNKLILLGAIAFFNPYTFISSISGFNLIILFVSLIFILILFIFSLLDKAIGMGDVKLLFMILLINGPNIFMKTIMILCFFTIVLALIILAKHGDKKTTFALGPIISISNLLTIIGG